MADTVLLLVKAIMHAGRKRRSSTSCDVLRISSLWHFKALAFSEIDSWTIERAMKPLSRHFAILVVVFATVTAFASPAWQQRPTGYVNDLAGVLTPSTISQLENICQQVDQHGRTQIAVVTVRSLEGQDIESYAVQLFKQWGIGYKGTDRGVLI